MILIILGFIASIVWYGFTILYFLRYKNKINESLNKKVAILYFINATIFLLIAIGYVYIKNGYMFSIDFILSLFVVYYQLYKLKK
jgi:hypothetical protein